MCISLNNGHEFDTNERVCNLCDVTKKIESIEIIDNSNLIYCELENKYDTYQHKYCEIDGACMSEFDIHCMECNRCHHFTQDHYCLGCNYCFDHIHKLCEYCNKCLSISGIKNTDITICNNCLLANNELGIDHKNVPDSSCINLSCSKSSKCTKCLIEFSTIFENDNYICFNCTNKKIKYGVNYIKLA